MSALRLRGSLRCALLQVSINLLVYEKIEFFPACCPLAGSSYGWKFLRWCESEASGINSTQLKYTAQKLISRAGGMMAVRITHAVAEVARRQRNTAARIAARAIVLVCVSVAELMFVNACVDSEVDRYETLPGTT